MRKWLGRHAAPWISALGLGPRTVTLQTVGHRSGKVRRVSLTMARHHGERYLVSLGGERAAWVANVRAAGGRATIIAGARRTVALVEVPVQERAPILHDWVTHRAFTHSAESSAREFFGFDHIPGETELAAVAHRYPVFRIEPARA